MAERSKALRSGRSLPWRRGPTETLDFNYIAYEEMNKRTKGNTESSSFIYTLPCIKKHQPAPCEGSNSRPSDYETDALPNCANEACAVMSCER
ncbi:unnamed protein product [Leuciscus chuanchicus]